jgi:hypothetical protein
MRDDDHRVDSVSQSWPARLLARYTWLLHFAMAGSVVFLAVHTAFDNRLVAQQDFNPKYYTVANWTGNIKIRHRKYATREPGDVFGTSLNAPNTLEESSAQIAFREEVDPLDGDMRIIMEKVEWKSNVSDLYYLNKDGSKVAAGPGGSGSGTHLASELLGRVLPLADGETGFIQDQVSRIRDAEQEVAQLEAEIARVEQEASAWENLANADERLADQIAEEAFNTYLETGENFPNQSQAAREAWSTANQSLMDLVHGRLRQMSDEHSRQVQELSQSIQGSSPSRMQEVARQMQDLQEQFSRTYTPLQESFSAKLRLQTFQENLDRARRGLYRFRKSVWRLQTRREHMAEAVVVYARDPVTDQPKTVSVDFSVSTAGYDQGIMRFPVKIIPLKIKGNRVVTASTAETRQTKSSATPAQASGPVNDDGTANLKFQDDRQSGEPGLIGGGEMTTEVSIQRNLHQVSMVWIDYKQPGATDGAQWQPAHEFVDFLVGQAQQAVQVRIETDPANLPIRWTLVPVGNASGSVTPRTGQSKEFSFEPNVARVRIVNGSPNPHPNGSRQPNSPVAYRLTVENSQNSTTLRQETIQQDRISILRQEFVDYGWQPPDRTDVGPAPALPSGLQLASDFNWGNYDPITLEGGWLFLAQQTQTALRDKIEINSAFRNPQRNRAIDGARRSVHMMGGAVDMDPVPDNAINMVKLHDAAFASGAVNILLERQGGRQGGVLLFPKNWRPPPGRHVFPVGQAMVEVEDSDGDGLPDRVIEIRAEPRNGIPGRTNLAYDGGGETNPDFRIRDTNNNGEIDPLEPLVLRYSLDGRQENALIEYYRAATHVHCDNGQLVQPLPR